MKAEAFTGKLYPQQASQALDAARCTANDLLKTAELLFEHERFSHCLALSILAMEEAGKFPIIFGIFLEYSQPSQGWKNYTTHAEKTPFINHGISMQIHNNFPGIPLETAQALANAGPSPSTLEKLKQLAIYSGCQKIKQKCKVHDPSKVEWKQVSHSILCDARVFVQTLRVYSASELTIWLKHAKLCQKDGRALQTQLVELEKELRVSGYIEEGWWKTILNTSSNQTK